MDAISILFYFFAFVTVMSAYFTVTTKNVIYAAFSLMLSLFGVAGLYVLLQADFIALVQLIVYVGGILILLLFGVMLTNKITDTEIKTGVLQILPGSIIVGMFAGILIAVTVKNPWLTRENTYIPLPSLGRALINEYALVFELLGVLLLIALIGAASIARK